MPAAEIDAYEVIHCWASVGGVELHRFEEIPRPLGMDLSIPQNRYLFPWLPATSCPGRIITKPRPSLRTTDFSRTVRRAARCGLTATSFLANW